jgi:hypothetical protein
MKELNAIRKAIHALTRERDLAVAELHQLKATAAPVADHAAQQLGASIDSLELSVRSANCLQRVGIKTIADLVQKSELDLLKTKNFGRKSLKEIKEILAEMGLSLGVKVDSAVLTSTLGGLNDQCALARADLNRLKEETERLQQAHTHLSFFDKAAQRIQAIRLQIGDRKDESDWLWMCVASMSRAFYGPGMRAQALADCVAILALWHIQFGESAESQATEVPVEFLKNRHPYKKGDRAVFVATQVLPLIHKGIVRVNALLVGESPALTQEQAAPASPTTEAAHG